MEHNLQISLEKWALYVRQKNLGVLQIIGETAPLRQDEFYP